MSVENKAVLFMQDMDGSMVPDDDGEWVRAEVYFELVEHMERMERMCVKPGWVLTPAEPTAEQLGAVAGQGRLTRRALYVAMIAARPEL